MRLIAKALFITACVVIVPGVASAQVTLAGAVKDASGAVLPGVTVEASSPALIEKVRSTTSDSAGNYRIEDLSAKKFFRFGGQRVTVGIDMYNLLNNDVTLAFNQTFVATVPGAAPSGSWPGTTTYMNPRVYRLNAEFSF